MTFASCITTVLEDETMAAIYLAAYEQVMTARRVIAKIGSCPTDEVLRARWEQQMDEATSRMEYAKGMVAATAYLPNSPFDETTSPVKVLGKLIEEPELALLLYP